jgi:hypothetical protein
VRLRRPFQEESVRRDFEPLARETLRVSLRVSNALQGQSGSPTGEANPAPQEKGPQRYFNAAAPTGWRVGMIDLLGPAGRWTVSFPQYKSQGVARC